MPRDQSFVALGQFLQKQHQPLMINQHAPANLDCTSKIKHIWFAIEKEPTQIKRAPAASNVMWCPLPLWGSFVFDFQFRSPELKFGISWWIPGSKINHNVFLTMSKGYRKSEIAGSISIRIGDCEGVLCLFGEDGDWRELFFSAN